MSQHLESLKIGATLLISGPHPKITYLGFSKFETRNSEVPINRKNFGGIAGGTGITPMYNIMSHSLENKDGMTNSLIFANHTSDDILLNKEIMELAKYNKDHFKVHHCISKEKISENLEDNMTYSSGRITKEIIYA